MLLVRSLGGSICWPMKIILVDNLAKVNKCKNNII